MLWGAGKPEIFNTDQGAQFTARACTSVLEAAGVRISMDGLGRAADHVFVGRLWRSVKYEDIYLKNYVRVLDLELGLESWGWRVIFGSITMNEFIGAWGIKPRLRYIWAMKNIGQKSTLVLLNRGLKIWGQSHVIL